MTTSVSLDQTAADPGLALASSYRRDVRASVERIWENVFDWEHLPALHDVYFNAVELLDQGDWGWRVRLSRQPGTADREQLLRLEVDRPATRYTVLTEAGKGVGTRIWTVMTPLSDQLTSIEVRYYLPEKRPEQLAILGEKYRASCDRLWSEDEAMMQQREAMARRKAPSDMADPMVLGPLAGLRQALPMTVEFGGLPFRIVEDGGELLVHSAVCPHWDGPLDTTPVVDGCVRCPWHNYLFDVRTGRSVDGKGFRLARPPALVIDPDSGVARLVRSPDAKSS